MLRRICAVFTLLAASLFVPAPAHAATCEDLYVPVTVALLPQTMHGRLCAPPGAKTVVVLVPGGTYNASYWDIAYTPQTRSFRLAMNNAGIATLALDRLGTGQSSKPLSTLLSASVQATAAHQVVQAVRPRFAKVVIGGHSIGSAMAMIEAGRYRDVDGVLVTGMTHRMNLVSVVPTLAQMHPAPLDPATPGRDVGYLTTDPGTRYGAFHTPGPLDAGALAYDESTKDVFAATEAVDSLTLTTVVIPVSRQITAPVLLVVGDDPNFCGLLGSDCSSPAALKASEAPFFGTSQLQTYILNGYGHAINYAPNAPLYFSVVGNWLRTLP
ncbi:alpha/beta hydrolase [Amycolatopsis sp. NPDC098790]|uniref:alpha/beta hydrolase n=1 Tax=Amycolatopsis sp. NPDC098790 TaxID=3363939 RepID=UPI00382C26F4